GAAPERAAACRPGRIGQLLDDRRRRARIRARRFPCRPVGVGLGRAVQRPQLVPARARSSRPRLRGALARRRACL
ncbi:MAG: hypothetical protein AVDCRST_MAG69-510, partial [uncultured Solirubrobacteraceae bacterium]